MVVYKSDIKRRYRDGSNAVESSPKRAKVHAQRKFAQCLSSSSISEKTFVKEKEKSKPNGNSEPTTPLLPADNRPKTEDFLTFLCFRGTPVLPSRLDFFNVASSSDQASTSANTSNQLSSEKLISKKIKLREKHSAVKIHPNKFKEKPLRKSRQVASRIDVKRRGNRVARRQAIRGNNAAVRRTPRSATRRPINSAVHRRIGDKRIRAGLRSGGVLPAGSEVGLSIFRRPRSSSSSQTVTYPVRKSAIPLGDSSEDEDEDDENEEEGEEEEEPVKASLDKKCLKDEKPSRSTKRGNSLRSHPIPANSVKQLPARKTKEAATAYMEMLSKTLRSPDPESDSYDEAEDPAKLEKEEKRTRRGPARNTEPPKKILPKKVLPGRSLKDKSLKRAPFVSQRKVKAKQIRMKRVEEITKRRTRSRTDMENTEEKSVRPRRAYHNKEIVELEYKESVSEVKPDHTSVKKKTEYKTIQQKKHSNQSPVSERRSRRFAKEEETEELEILDKKPPKEGNKKPIKKNIVVLPCDDIKSTVSQEVKIGRRSKGAKTDLKEPEIRNSPSRLRNQDSKKDNKTEVELQIEPKQSSPKQAAKKVSTKKTIKAEPLDDLPLSNRRSALKKQAKLENNEETKSSSTRLRNQTKKKDIKDEIKMEPDLKAVGTPTLKLSKSNIKKDIKIEGDLQEVHNSPGRTLRKSSTFEKALIKDEPKTTPAIKVSNEAGKKKEQELKTKVSASKEEVKNIDEDSKKIAEVEEPLSKPKRNSRSSAALETALNKNKVLSKAEETTESPVASEPEDKKPKRGVKKKSEIKVEITESEDVGKKQSTKKQSNIKSKVTVDHKSVEEKQNSQEQNKSNVEKVIETGLKQVNSDISECNPKTKPGGRKKCNVSDDEISPKEAPKKKLKQSQDVDKDVNINTKVASIPDEALTPKQVHPIPVKTKRDSKKKINESKKEFVEPDKRPDSVLALDVAVASVHPCAQQFVSREGSIDKQEERDLKGFDEDTAKEMESKVDKFIEQMILKTSDDESKSKMRSRHKQTGVKEEAVKTRAGKHGPSKNLKGSDKPKTIRAQSMDSVKEEIVQGTMKSIEEVNEKLISSDKIESETLSRGRKSSLSKQKEKSLSDESKNYVTGKNEKEDITAVAAPSKKEAKSFVKDNEEKAFPPCEPKRNPVADEKLNKGKVGRRPNNLEQKKECGTSPLDSKQEDVKCVAISESQRISVSSRLSSDTTISECRVVLENVVKVTGVVKSRKAHDASLNQNATKGSLDANKQKTEKTVEPKPRNRGKARTKKVEDSLSESSNSDDEPLAKRSAKLRLARKRNSPNDNKPRPRRRAKEIRPLETKLIPLRTSRDRVAKHSSSSFYYETDSSSHYSSSEEEMPVKKVESSSVSKEMIPHLTNTKEPPKEIQLVKTDIVPPTLSITSKTQPTEDKKVIEIPEDLIDFKSDFDRNDVLLMYPGLKDARHLAKEEVLSQDDVRKIVKDIKTGIPKLTEIPSTSSPANISPISTLPEGIKVITPDSKSSYDSKSMYDEARGSMDLLASVAENISAKMNSTQLALPKVTVAPTVTPKSNSPVSVPTNVPLTPPNDTDIKSCPSPSGEENNALVSPVENKEETKPKQKPSSLGETWIQAFKRAKIPKPGHSSPISHSVKPFVRKPFMNQPFVSKQPSPLKCDTPDVKFKPFDRSSLMKPHKSSTVSGPSKQSGFPYNSSSSNTSTIPLVKPLTAGILSNVKKVPAVKATLAVPTLSIPNPDIKKEQKLGNILNQPVTSKNQGPPITRESLFKPMEVKSEDIKNKSMPHPSRLADPSRRVELIKETTGKHQNLPLAVEHTLRKMSPVAVSRKPVASVTLKPQVQLKDSDSKDPNIFEQSKSNRSSPSSGSKSSWLWKPEMVTKASDLELMAKKKVTMTPEEIEKWLDDSTSTGIEHSKDCGLFEKNQCECSFRTSGSSMQNSVTVLEHSSKVGPSIVEPPMQLKDLEPKCTAETISTCKVEDYKEKLISKSPINLPKEDKQEGKKDATGKFKSLTPSKQEKPWKSTRSMTEEEMCEFDFRFERNSNSPRESCSEMSSPTPKDEMSSSNDEGIGSHQSEKKSIFHKKSRTLSKSPCAFNAENESSVYAFEPDSDLPVSRPLFRRKMATKPGADEPGRSNSIAVQVYLEPEAVLESSTQTDREEEDGGTTFYIPLRSKSVEPQQMIQGVTVKLDADPDGQEHRVTLRAKLVTKPQSDFPRPPTSRSLVGRSSGKSGKPEQKVRPLSLSDPKPPVGTVQPTMRSMADQPTIKPTADQLASTSQESFATSTSSKSSQSTQFSATPLKHATDNKATSPLQTNSKLASDPPHSVTRSESESGFPKVGMSPRLVEAPAFYPSEKEFSDPLEYLEKITPEAEHYGICRIVPPPSFKPECKVSDDMRFTSYNQYVHKMMKRWGPNVKEMTAIKKYLATQSIALTHPPWIGGMEVDLPRLYQTVQQCGGLKEVIEKKRWTKVADSMKIPKSAQDRVTKLDDIYCKYLLPYDTLSHEERCKLLEQVERDWEEKERRILLGESTNNSEESESDSDDGMMECITKGRSMALSQFYRIARNTLWMWFGSEGDPPPSEKIEVEYWNQVKDRMSHVCVNSGSIDCGTWGYGFPTAKTSSTSKHPWNLKVLTNHPHSVLRSLPPLMGVTVPTLHVGMLFSTFCWYRDPHGLPWIEYLHTGANKIWYGVPDKWTNQLRGAIKSVLPSIVRESPVWLPSDTAMLPPQLLLEKGVSLCRTVQEPGQFIVIFPKAYTSAICTGYLVSESVYYAPSSWLATAQLLFKEVKESSEPTMFSLEKLLFYIANDARSSLDILIQVCPMVESVKDREVNDRKELEKVGLESSERLPKPSKRTTGSQQQDYECTTCRSNLFLSLVSNSNEDANYCLADALDMLSKDSSQLKYCKLLYLYDEEEMEELVEKIKLKIDIKSHKKSSKGGCGSIKT